MFELFFKVRADHHRDDERVPGEHHPHHGVADKVPEIHEHRGQRAENYQRGLAPQSTPRLLSTSPWSHTRSKKGEENEHRDKIGKMFQVERYKTKIVTYQAEEWLSSATLVMLNIFQSVVMNGGLLGISLYCAYKVDCHILVLISIGVSFNF